MKTRKHGNGLSHKEIVQFSNRLMSAAVAAKQEASINKTYWAGWDEGYAFACKYFAHQLREYLRNYEQYDN